MIQADSAYLWRLHFRAMLNINSEKLVPMLLNQLFPIINPTNKRVERIHSLSISLRTGLRHSTDSKPVSRQQMLLFTEGSTVLATHLGRRILPLRSICPTSSTTSMVVISVMRSVTVAILLVLEVQQVVAVLIFVLSFGFTVMTTFAHLMQK